MVLYLDQTLIYFSVNFAIVNISAPIFCPLLTKLRAALRQYLVYFVNFYVVGYKFVGSETSVVISPSSGVYGEYKNRQVISVIINFYQHFFQY